MKIRIGILGCANIAKRSLIPAICKLSSHFELAGVASRNASKALEFATLFSCKTYATYKELVDAPDIDALYIPLPTGLHKEWVTRSLSAGKHVYVEKSIATCESDARSMVDLARSKSLSLMEGYMFQYHSQHSKIKSLLESGVVGELRYFSSSFSFPPLDSSNFRYDDAIGGGVLLDAAGYPLRATHFLLGDQMEVVGATLFHDVKKGTQIFGSAFLSNARGLGASLAFSFDSFYQCRYELVGQDGKLIVDRAFTLPPDASPQITLESAGSLERIMAASDNHFVKALMTFHVATHDFSERTRLYKEILLQSKSLDAIKHFALFNKEAPL